MEGKVTKVADLTEKLSVRKPLKSTTGKDHFFFKATACQRQLAKLNPTMRPAARIQAQTNSGNRLYINCSKHPDLKHDRRNIKDETT